MELSEPENTRTERRGSAAGGILACLAEILTKPAKPVSSRRETLDELVALFLAVPLCLDAVLFDCRMGLAGKPRIGDIVPSPSKTVAEGILAKMVDDPIWLRGPSDAFAAGRWPWNHGGVHVVGLRFSIGERVVGGGYLLFRALPTPEQLEDIRALCRLSEFVLDIAHDRGAHPAANSEVRASIAEMNDALRLGADAYWRADEAGVIRHVALFSSDDCAPHLQSLAGKRLRELVSPAHLATAAPFRAVRVQIATMGGVTRLIELSGHAPSGGPWQGIARILSSMPQTAINDAGARSLIDKLEAARNHEAELRHESEIMLDGLRVMTSGKPGHQVFYELLALLAPALGFEDAVILQREWAGAITVAVASGPALSDLDWQSAGDTLLSIDEIATSLHAPRDVVLPTARGTGPFASALSVKLVGGSKPMVLLCLHRAQNFFTTRHLGLGTRLSLIASQALLTEGERQKVINASKLATIGEMAAGIVHEINQPLTAMALAAGNIRAMLERGENCDLDKLLVKAVKVETQIGRLSKIIANMRVLSRHSDGGIMPFALAPAIGEAANVIQHKLSKARAEIEVIVPEDLEAYGNSLEFTQVMINLFSNAIDAIELGEPRAAYLDAKARLIFVSVEASDPNTVVVRVQDTGPGFPAGAAEKAFEPFFTTKEAGKGTGLGLALCRRIVENMGGTIALNNWANGAQVQLQLKRYRPSAA